MSETSFHNILLPVSELSAACQKLQRQCSRYLNPQRQGFDKKQARARWAKFLRLQALLDLAQATRRGGKQQSLRPVHLRDWGRLCGADAIPYLVTLHSQSRRNDVRRGIIEAIADACAAENRTTQTNVPAVGVFKVSPKSAKASRLQSGIGPSPRCLVLIEGLREPLSLQELHSITVKWVATNRRRLKLIEKAAKKRLAPEERRELKSLQRLADAKRQLLMPLPIKQLSEIEAEFRRQGLWQGA